MSTDPTAPAAEPEPRAGRGPSRRAVLLGAVGALVAVGAGVPLQRALTAPPDRVAAMHRLHPFVVAHRGGDADWPEMSLLAYRNALALGVDAVEVSLARTSDGVWFGLHDPTLDRTSGTSGFVAAEHTWAQVSTHRISASGIADASVGPQPYARFEDVVAAVDRRCPIFVDPKEAQAYATELLDLMAGLVRRPTEVFVAKGQADTQVAWGRAARARGYQTWGYWWAADLAAHPGLTTSTRQPWTMLGLDVDASATQWSAVRAIGRPVIAHSVETAAQARTATALGAAGLMASDVRAALAERSATPPPSVPARGDS